MKRGVITAAFAAALVTALVFLPVVDNRFVTWEDALTITANPYITAITPQFFRWAFFQQHGLFWMPLTWISLALDYRFWGMNPFGYHLTNLLIHAANTAMVALLTVQLLRICGKEGGAEEPIPEALLPFAALAAGLIFGLHPLRVEAVAWASERKGLLNAFFVLPAVMAYLAYARQPEASSPFLTVRLSQRRYLASLALFIFSLLCKPMTVSLPVVLLILDWYPLGRLTETRGRINALVEKFPFLAGSAAVSVITLMLKPPGDITLAEISLSSRLHVACRALVEYLRLMVWPSDLMALYDHPANSVAVTSATFWWPIVAVVAVSLACAAAARCRKVWLAVWLGYVTILLPVLGFAQNGGQSMADRFMYLPGIALALPAVAALSLLRDKVAPRLARHGGVAILLAVSVAFGLVSRGLIGTWHDTESLWTRAIAARPAEAGRARYQRGMEYLERGDFARAREDADAALAILGQIGYTRIAKVYELRAMAYEGLGIENEATGDYEMVRRLPSAWSPPQ